jgi:ParB/RepB/Spo0J family partition protein
MPQLKTSEILAENNIRHKLDEVSIKDLAQSIITVHELSGGEKTLLQPVVVEKLEKKTGGKTHKLRYGFRRLAAMCYLAETYPEKCFWAKNIPVIIDGAVYNEVEGSLKNFQLIENIQRESMTLLEEAMTMERIMQDGKLSQSALAKTLGKSKGWVSQRLALLKMDESIQLGVQEGKFGQAHVREFSRIKKKTAQKEVATKLLKEKKPASVEQVRRAVNKVSGPPAPKAPKKNAAPKPEVKPEAPATEAEAETQLDLAPAPEPASASPSRGEILKSMTHEDKVNLIKEEAFEKDENAKKVVLLEADADTRTITLEGELKRLNKAAATARKKGAATEAAYFDGAAQAIKFALGSVKSIRYVEKKVAS